MIATNKPLPQWSIAHAAQANLEISHRYLWRVLAYLCSIFVPGRYSILYYQYRFKHGTGAFRAYRRPGVGIPE